MADFNILPIGLKTGTQLPLDAKSRSVSELVLSSLGVDDQLAFTYEEGLIVRCIAEGTNYIWRSVQTSEPIAGLLTSNFTYPQGIVVGDVSYSGRAFNFFKLDYVIQTQFAQKVDKVTGERLINASEITKLLSLQNVQLVNPDWDATSGFAEILNKPVIIDAASYATKVYADTADNLRVLKQTGYSLTKNDLTDNLKNNYDAAVQWIISNGNSVSNSDYNLNLHINNSQNPHFVTKSQVGLGLADDTSDLEKPISLDAQSALNLKADLINGIIPASQLPDFSNTGILKQSLATGLSAGGLLEINTNASRFNSNAGSGYIVNGTLDVNNPTATKVTWDTQTGIVVPNIGSTKTTYVARDINGALFFSANPLTATQRRNYIRLGVLVHLNNTIIEYIDNQPTINIELGGQVHDILDVLGFRSLSGNRIFPASTNLKIRKEQGRVFKPGANFNILTTQPHSFILPLQDPVTFRYRTQTGNEGADVTDINPAIYDVNGTFTGMPSTATLASIQRVYIFQDGVIRIQPGQRFFTNLSEAIIAINSDVFITDDDISNNGLYLGAIVLTRNSTNLSNIIEAIFVPSQGTTTNGSVPSSAPLGYNPENVANKQDTLQPDGTGSKYPTVDATLLALSSKADLVNGIVPLSQLPSYVDDVLEFSSSSSFPTVGEIGKIYIAVNPKNEQYRWSGSSYIQITNGLIASTNDLVEGAANLYFLQSRVLSTVLSGLVTSTNSIITSADSSLIAFGKLQSQINQKQNSLVFDGTGLKYPTVDGTNAGLALKANITFLNVKDFGAVGNGVNNDKAAIENAIAALPAKGGVVYIPNGTYYSPSGYLINRDNVTLIGENMPTTNISLESLTGGSILQGGIIIDGNNINVENLGADFGITYSNARRSGTGGDGFVIHKVGLNGIIKNISVKNVIGLVRIGDFNDAQAAFHAVLLEGIQFGSATNVVGIGGWFGIVIKATDFNATNLTARENDAASVYIKSNSYAPSARVNVSNINISNFSARGFIGLLIQSSDAELQNVSANNINVNGGGTAVRVEAEATEPCVAVSVSNVTARGLNSGISVRGAVYSFVSSNSVIYSPINSGFQTSVNTSSISPIDVLVDNLRVMPSATTTIAVNIGDVNTKGVFSNINVSGTDGKTLIAGSVINLQPDSNINNYVGLLKRGGVLTDSYRFKGGRTTTGLLDILTTVNKRSDFANPLISLVEGYLANDKPFLQGFNNFNNAAVGLEINPFGGDVSFGATVNAVNLKASSLAGTGTRNVQVDANGTLTAALAVTTSGTFTPNTNGDLSYSKSYFTRVGNVVTITLNGVLNSAASIMTTLTLPNSFTINTPSANRIIGTGIATRQSNYSANGDSIITESGTNSVVNIMVFTPATGTYYFSTVFSFEAN